MVIKLEECEKKIIFLTDMFFNYSLLYLG